jgi:lysophospholipase L1-like esterase
MRAFIIFWGMANVVAGCAQEAAIPSAPVAKVASKEITKSVSDAPNLALGRPFVSSDINRAGWNKGLTDGSWRGSIGSVFATGGSHAFPKTVTVDLQASHTVVSVAVGVPHFGSTKTVRVSLSADQTNFQEVGTYVFSLRKEEKHLFSFAPTRARYVRLTYIDNYDESVIYPAGHAFTSELAAYAPGGAPILEAARPPEAANVAAPQYGAKGEIEPAFLALHQSFLRRGKAGPIGVLFLGDSITFRWRVSAKPIWEKKFGGLEAANFGISRDKTQHVLWRIENGELDGISPKVVVLLLGTNNLSASPGGTILGVRQVVAEIHRRLPNTKVLLLGIFPRGAKPSNAFRAQIKGVNAELAKLDDGKKTRFLDFGNQFLAPNGEISREMMPDALHPGALGYQIWADAMSPLLDEMMTC